MVAYGFRLLTVEVTRELDRTPLTFGNVGGASYIRMLARQLMAHSGEVCVETSKRPAAGEDADRDAPTTHEELAREDP